LTYAREIEAFPATAGMLPLPLLFCITSVLIEKDKRKVPQLKLAQVSVL